MHVVVLPRSHKYNAIVGRHFNQPGHTSAHFQCRVIHLLPGTPILKDDKRTDKEEAFMDQLKTREPLCLNDKGRKRTVHY
jgi:hypothetical protein